MNSLRRTPVWIAASLALSLSIATVASAGAQGRSLQLYKTLPKDPLLVLAVHVDDPAVELNELLEMVSRMASQGGGPEEAAAPFEGFGSALVSILPRDLLNNIGPEIVVVVDLPPIDEAVEAIQGSGASTLDMLLGDVGLVANAKDARRLDAALRLMLSALGGEVTETAGVVHANVPVADTPMTTSINVHYTIRKGRLVLGFSERWVTATIDGYPNGQRLTDGEDFGRVFSQLDPKPTDLTYVNLPKVREYVTGSRIVQAVVRANPEARFFVERFFTPETMGVGLGSTSVTLERGVRTTNFGPSWMSGAVTSSGMLAAMAVPNMMSAVDEGRTRRTVTDIEAIAEACEGFSVDSQSYPGPTDGWVPVDSLAAYLEPVYIGTLPRQDAWEHPLLYWSDGGSYRIISTGKDGEMDRDWSSIAGPAGDAPVLAGDIVYGDGHLMVVNDRVRED